MLGLSLSCLIREQRCAQRVNHSPCMLPMDLSVCFCLFPFRSFPLIQRHTVIFAGTRSKTGQLLDFKKVETHPPPPSLFPSPPFYPARALQDKNTTRQDKTRQDKTRQDKTRQDKTRQEQDKTRQPKDNHKIRSDKTRQDKTSQDKTRPSAPFSHGDTSRHGE